MKAFKILSALRTTAFLLCIVATLCTAQDAGLGAPETELPALTLLPRCGVPFQDNAVLQQNIPLPVWGTSLPGAKVTITLGDRTSTSIANANGAWRVILDPIAAIRLTSVNDAPKGMTMVIVCEKDGAKAVKSINNLLIGELWLCAGQSNMAGKMGTHKERHFPEDSIAKANYPALRQMVSPEAQPWLVCTPETAPQFKKVGFFFARRLQREILVPVGIINAAVGGSKIETWLNQQPFERGQNYDQKIAPLIGYGLRGMVWYQGESNENDRREYFPKLRSLITGWRDAWGQGDQPFYFVQLPGIGKPGLDNPAGGNGRAEIRQAQFEALALKNTGMAVTIDVGDVKEHPPNKYDTGVRLARLALHNDYGLADLAPTGPLYRSHRIEGDTIRVFFDHANNGLMLAAKKGFSPPVETPETKLSWLAIQDKGGTWHWADGRIEGSELMVSCKDVSEPVAVRYAYTNHPTGTLLYSKDGLPTGPFSTNGYQ